MMSTLAIRAPHAPKALLQLSGFFGRIGTVVLAVIDVFAEAQRQAHDAQQRYPFTAW
jgi:hypothetical protein